MLEISWEQISKPWGSLLAWMCHYLFIFLQWSFPKQAIRIMVLWVYCIQICNFERDLRSFTSHHSWLGAAELKMVSYCWKLVSTGPHATLPHLHHTFPVNTGTLELFSTTLTLLPELVHDMKLIFHFFSS